MLSLKIPKKSESRVEMESSPEESRFLYREKKQNIHSYHERKIRKVETRTNST